MCGFLAEYGFDNSELTEASVFANVLALSKHRGPDATEIERQGNFQLGFNRLSILDLSANGNQPKESPSGRFHMVFNGEIYNFKQLAKEHNLQNLKSSSDSEVIVHLLDLFGVESTIKQLNGMFAIAVVDVHSNCIYLTRDFAGIKPLYFGMHSTGVIAASQFNQIYKHPEFSNNLELRPEIVKEYFGFGYMQAPNTIYKNIFQVNPGELIKINTLGAIENKSITAFSKDYELSSDGFDFKNILQNAVERQLVSDVPVASFLSGGIDSPLITAYAKLSKPDIEAFTLKIDHPELNESDIAEAYAKYFEIKQQVVSVNETDLLDSIDNHFKAFTEPFGDYSSIPTYVITGHAKQSHTVMLSGDGGDELFFGYPRMRDVLNKRKWFKYPLFIRKNIVRLTNRLGLTNTYAPYFKSLNDFIMHKHIHIAESVLDEVFPQIDFSDSMKSLYKFNNLSRNQLLHELRWNEFYAHMQRVLVKVDRSSMKHSLEVRVPFLDKEVIDSSWKLQAELRSKHDLKIILKSLLAEQLPESLINQKKMGFSVPIKNWLHHQLKADVLLHVLDKPFYGEAIMDVDVLKTYVLDFYDKKHHDAWGIWHIYAWQKWASHQL